MGCRGLWNLHINGKWYRLYHPRGRISPPDDESTLRTIKHLCDKPDNLAGWEPAPFPSPIHSILDYIYTIDIDAVRMDLAKIHKISRINHHMIRKAEYMSSEYICESNKAQAKQFETFEMEYGIPTPINELQGQFFTDLRFYIDDPSIWRYNSPIFRDFEVSFEDCNVELPISFASLPLWSYPDADDDLESIAIINGAVSKARSYIGNSRLTYNDVRLIVISPRYLVFVELSREVVLASRSLVLLSNYSATQCSSRFRALARKKPRAHREKWRINVPPEIVQMILYKLEPRDAVAFSQASFAAEQCYYTSESQFKNIDVQSFKSSIPCCGKRTGLETHGICCSECHVWQHLECVGLENDSSDYRYVCMGCHGRAHMVLDPGR
ncbi:hypothetical protein N7516_005767, partial [Penicillium verrucosum]|uniref:uncharacterized protein n=1 Tax=Penicillium verrucosum TaxID=60171 RepID=UPI002545BC8F